MIATGNAAAATLISGQSEAIAIRLELLRVAVDSKAVTNPAHVIEAAVGLADPLDRHQPARAQHGAIDRPSISPSAVTNRLASS